MRVRWKSALPVIGILGGILASPQVLAVIPDNWTHVVVGLSALAAIFAPAAVTNKPKAE